MDKTAIDQSKEQGQTSKPSGVSSTVLNILKRFRSRRSGAEDQEPSFDDRLGAASGPLAERISEISNLIEADRSRGAKSSEPSSADGAENSGDTQEENKPAAEDAAAEDSVETNATETADARPKPRVRSMGFHNPVFPAKAPDEPKDPDFVASTQPPALKLHDAPDGVMENSGAPEKRLTAQKEKAMEPLDLGVFAEQVRANLPKPEPKTPAVDEDASENAATEADAAAFKQQFYSRISKASKASAFEAFSAAEEPRLLNMPASIMSLEARDVTASSALQSWRKFQSPGGRKTDGEETGRLNAPLHTVDTEAEKSMVEPAAAEEPEGEELATPETGGYAAEQDPHQFDYPSFEPRIGGRDTEPEQDGPSEDRQGSAPEPTAEPKPEPKADQMEAPEPEVLSDFEPAAADTANGPQNGEPGDTFQIAPDNLFAALGIDEEELLTNVYDVIQAELHAAWGENVALNIRKIVREEVRAALEKARSDS